MTTHRDDGSVIEDVVLCAEEGHYGVNIPKGVWLMRLCLFVGLRRSMR